MHKRYEPPYPEIPTLKLEKTNTIDPLISDYTVEVTENKVGFLIRRKSDNVTM